MVAGTRNVPSAEGAARRGDNPVIQLVGFRLDKEDYAIAITKIQEIILMKPITRIPQVPDFIEGLINLRGSVIPIVNLRKRFGLAPREVDDETRTIVVNIHDKTVGCIVDAVTQVMRINRDQIQPPPLSVLSVSHQYISGLARLDERLLIILDIERLFDEQSPVVSGQWQEKVRRSASRDGHLTGRQDSGFEIPDHPDVGRRKRPIDKPGGARGAPNPLNPTIKKPCHTNRKIGDRRGRRKTAGHMEYRKSPAHVGRRRPAASRKPGPRRSGASRPSRPCGARPRRSTSPRRPTPSWPRPTPTPRR